MKAIKQKSPIKEDQYRSTLRTSSQFLNMLMLRNTLANNSYPKLMGINDSLYLKRLSNLNNGRYQPIGKQTGNNQVAYAKLKDTLQSLQTKIQKAQKILCSPCKKTPKSKHTFELDIEITLSDMDERTTKKNDESSKFMNNQQKISQISKNSSMTTHKICKNVSQQGSKINKQYYLCNLLTMSSPAADPRIKQHIKLSFDVFKKLGNYQAPDYKQISACKVSLPYNRADKKTLLLDIDDTILNCDDTKDEQSDYDFELGIEDEDGSEFTVYIRLRPYALTFLKNISRYYEVVAYTGSIENYAKKVISEIDPDGQIFAYQLYRDKCFQIFNGVYVKDIRIINRRPQNIVLVDNSPYSYIYQLQNGVPILAYEKGHDDQLPKLQKYLIWLSNCRDIREVNKQIFKFHLYHEFESVDEVAACLYGITRV